MSIDFVFVYLEFAYRIPVQTRIRHTMLKPGVQSNDHLLPVWAMTSIHDPNADAIHIWEFQV
jgi:hypothetical protein